MKDFTSYDSQKPFNQTSKVGLFLSPSPIDQPLSRSRRSRLAALMAGMISLLVLASVLAVFAAVHASSGPLSSITGTSATGFSPNAAHGPVSAAFPVSGLSTTCPAAGKGRAMVLAPLALKHRATLVYLVVDAQASTLKRYDVITGQRADIIHLPGVTISSAQVSADGQWVLFSAGSKLQVVRVDGRGLQTLYCDPTSRNFQWSTNQQLIAFERKSGSTGTIQLLHVTTGMLETAFSQPLNTPYVYQLRTWLDNSHLYLTRTDTDVPPDVLAVLDLHKGLHQTISALISVIQPEPGTFQDFDSSFDGKQVFVAHSQCAYDCSGPGDIIAEPAFGGSPLTVFQSDYSIVCLRVATPNNLLFLVDNRGFPVPGSGDLSHNGLWTLLSDGRDSRLIRLTTDTASLFTTLNAYSQYPWSNASRDNRWYAAEQDANQSNGHAGTQALLIGSLSGGAPTRFAWMSDGTQLHIVGWTTL